MCRNIYGHEQLHPLGRIVACRNKEQWQQMGIYMIKYKEKWEWMVRKHESEA
jgi:hypothetical protein